MTWLLSFSMLVFPDIRLLTPVIFDARISRHLRLCPCVIPISRHSRLSHFLASFFDSKSLSCGWLWFPMIFAAFCAHFLPFLHLPDSCNLTPVIVHPFFVSFESPVLGCLWVSHDFRGLLLIFDLWLPFLALGSRLPAFPTLGIPGSHHCRLLALATHDSPIVLI
jgi:hypothetical protein